LAETRQQKYWDQGRSTALLRVGREPEKAVDLALRQKPLGLGRGVQKPRDVPVGIEPDLGDDAGDEGVLRGIQLGDGDRLAFQVAERPHPLAPEQLEAPDVHAAQEDDRLSRVEGDDQRRGEVHGDVDLTGAHRLGHCRP